MLRRAPPKIILLTFPWNVALYSSPPSVTTTSYYDERSELHGRLFCLTLETAVELAATTLRTEVLAMCIIIS